MNGWAGIMVDAEQRKGTVAIRRNVVRDAHCGDGIDIRLRGSASYRAAIDSNLVHRLEEGEDFQSLLAIGLQTRDTSRLVATLDRNEQTELGNIAAPTARASSSTPSGRRASTSRCGATPTPTPAASAGSRPTGWRW